MSETHKDIPFSIGPTVALSPFPSRAIESKIVNGVKTIAQKTELSKLQVVFDYYDQSTPLHRGDFVYVKGDLSKQNYAAQVWSVDGDNFILVPASEIILVQRHQDPLDGAL